MTITKVDDDTFRIANPAFRDVVFTASSPDYLTLPAAVAFARDKGVVLESARESAAFRIEADGQDDANRYRITRTVVAYFKDGNTWRAAIDDSADPAQNILLARAEEGYAAHQTGNKWLVPRNDVYVRGLLDRAEKAGSIVPAQEASPLELATQAASGRSPFGQHALMRAIFGDDVAEAYAKFLNQNRRNTGYGYSLTLKILESMDIGSENAEIRLVGLGGDGDYYLGGVVADFLCGYVGRARGVRSVSAERTV